MSSCDPTLPPLSEDIPDSDPFFPKYGPSFELAITQGMRTNSNSAQDLDDILEKAFGMTYKELCGSKSCFGALWYSTKVVRELFSRIYQELFGGERCLGALK
jgi:hypothetical protein